MASSELVLRSFRSSHSAFGLGVWVCVNFFCVYEKNPSKPRQEEEVGSEDRSRRACILMSGWGGGILLSALFSMSKAVRSMLRICTGYDRDLSGTCSEVARFVYFWMGYAGPHFVIMSTESIGNISRERFHLTNRVIMPILWWADFPAPERRLGWKATAA